jgi:type I restriction enzyme S subunit
MKKILTKLVSENDASKVELRQLGSFRKGPFGSSLTKAMFVPRSSKSIKVYEQKNAIQKSCNLGNYYISKDYFEDKMKGFECKSGDILVSCAGTIGETYILPENIEKGIINQALMKVTLDNKKIDTNYFLKAFDHIISSQSVSDASGSAMKNIPPFKIFKAYKVPLPSLLEQQKIVERIEAVEKVLDKLEVDE